VTLLLLILLAICMRKVNSFDYTVSPTVETWESRYIAYDNGWYIDADIYNLQQLEEEIEVIYGPFMPINEGNYYLKVDYETESVQNIRLYSFENEDKITTDGNLMLLSESEEYIVPFNISQNLENFEVRLKYNGEGYFKIKNISILNKEWITYYYMMIAIIILFMVMVCFGFVYCIYGKNDDSQEAKRVKWIDFARGLGIILASLGHFGGFAGSWFIYGFHMPLFFMISGYLFKEKPFKDFVVNLLKRYIWPYILFCFLNSLLRIPYCMRGIWSAKGIFKAIINYMIGSMEGNWRLMPNCTPLWFLTASAAATFIFFFIKKAGGKILRGVLVLSMAVAGVLIMTTFRIELPWGLHTVPMAVFFMAAGNYVKEYNLIDKISSLTSVKKTGLTAALGCAGAGAILINHFYSSDLDIFLDKCGNPIFMIIGAICMTIFTMQLSICLASRFANILKYVILLGEHSLFYFSFDHWSNLIAGKFCGVDMSGYWYIALPVKIMLVSLLFIIWQLLISPLKKKAVYKYLNY